MATNYRQTNVAGIQWDRCSNVTIHNPYGGPATIALLNETVAQVGGQTVTLARKPLTAPFDPAAVIALRNPETDALTGGSITQGEVYAILYSLYRAMADEAAPKKAAA